ncbi:hypothetical protein BB558_004925 [Smittium angustum]|uniref:Aromatic-L-amino-acid decarboxylase n=1 Tax=Smittium angustum TaxID=133377 RepID=A0A2U1J238_SMIAN|nr:hypothetical protein BB558_004925 [Smittium angustum]
MQSENSFPPMGMTSAEFRRRGKELIDYIADYYDNINEVKPLSEVKPNYLRPLLPEQAPEDPEPFDNIIKDLETKILPGVTHWQSGNFLGYFPASSSYPGILGELLSATFNGIGFSWINGPAMTELETVMLDWLAKLMGLSEDFMSKRSDGKPSSGGGVIQGSASEAIIVAMIAARQKAVSKFEESNPNHTVEELDLFKSKLIAYGTDQTHSSGEKASMIINSKFGTIKTGSDGSLTKGLLRAAIDEDKKKGLVPYFVVGTFGTTAICATDDFNGIADITSEEDIWFHLDAAYAGASLICPEFRSLAPGMNRSDSFNFNPHKWLAVNFDCSTLWFKNSYYAKSALSIHRDYYKNAATDSGLVQDYKDWQLPLGRRFRSLKLWFVLRTYGANGLRNHIRKTVNYAKLLESELRKDGRFDILYPVNLSLVVSQVSKEAVSAATGLEIGSEALNEAHRKANTLVHQNILHENKIFPTTAVINGVTALRSAVGSVNTNDETMQNVVNAYLGAADKALSNTELLSSK